MNECTGPEPHRMTLGVYRVAPDGSRATVKPTRPVKPYTRPLISQRYPPCRCPRCRPGRQ